MITVSIKVVRKGGRDVLIEETSISEKKDESYVIKIEANLPVSIITSIIIGDQGKEIDSAEEKEVLRILKLEALLDRTELSTIFRDI